jgi:hypothetical protein
MPTYGVFGLPVTYPAGVALICWYIMFLYLYVIAGSVAAFRFLWDWVFDYDRDVEVGLLSLFC